MEHRHTITFEVREDYYAYGRNDAESGVFDTAYIDRSEDARLSYLAGWASVPAENRRNGKPEVI